MAVKGLDIFKLSPKKNCKECGSPTCMAFCMKVAQGAVEITKCPYMSAEAVALLSEATAPPMKTITVGEHKLGGETVMMRHEKTLVNRNLFAATLCTCMDDAKVEERIEGIKKVDYERIGEREMVECVFVHDAGDSAKFVELCKKAAAIGDRTVIIDTKDVDTAKAAVEAIKDNKPILNGANKDNFAAMNEIATAAGIVLGVHGADLSELHDIVAELEKAGNKNLILDVTAETIKETFANAVLVRRTAIKDGDRTFGYPSIVNLGVLCDHNEPGQSVTGLENAVIAGVVDHHRFGNFTTAAPLHIVALPWGSSCSIVAKLFEVLGVEPTDVQAKLLLSAMMTDTLMLKSPTATAIDAAIAKKLGDQIGVDPVKFGMEVFLTRPSGSFTAEQMVGNDIKMFEVAGKSLLIGQYETVDKTRALGMIPEIREAMRAYQAEKGADGIVLCLTDIMEEGSQVLLEGDTAAAQKGLGIADESDGVWMPGVLSRKKQVAAPILAAAE